VSTWGVPRWRRAKNWPHKPEFIFSRYLTELCGIVFCYVIFLLFSFVRVRDILVQVLILRLAFIIIIIILRLAFIIIIILRLVFIIIIIICANLRLYPHPQYGLLTKYLLGFCIREYWNEHVTPGIRSTGIVRGYYYYYYYYAGWRLIDVFNHNDISLKYVIKYSVI